MSHLNVKNCRNWMSEELGWNWNKSRGTPAAIYYLKVKILSLTGG